MILGSCDNSADARAAIDGVAELMPGANPTVLTVWEPLRDTVTRTTSFGMGMVGSYAASDQVDAAILAVGATVDADRVVTGTRGRSGIQAFLLAASPTQSSSTPTAVVVVPSPVLAERRRDQRRAAPA
jgi:hypothetical protein